jgi:hypothetical protein
LDRPEPDWMIVNTLLSTGHLWIVFHPIISFLNIRLMSPKILIYTEIISVHGKILLLRLGKPKTFFNLISLHIIYIHSLTQN